MQCKKNEEVRESIKKMLEARTKAGLTEPSDTSFLGPGAASQRQGATHWSGTPKVMAQTIADLPIIAPKHESEIETLTKALAEAMAEVKARKCTRKNVYHRTATIYNEMTLKLLFDCTDRPHNHRTNLTSASTITQFVNEKLSEMESIDLLHRSMDENERMNDHIALATNDWGCPDEVLANIFVGCPDEGEGCADEVLANALVTTNTVFDEFRAGVKTEPLSSNDVIEQDRKRKRAEMKRATDKKRRAAAKELAMNRPLTLEECQRIPLDKVLTTAVLQEYCTMAGLIRAGSIENLCTRLVTAMQSCDVSTLGDYIAMRDKK